MMAAVGATRGPPGGLGGQGSAHQLWQLPLYAERTNSMSSLAYVLPILQAPSQGECLAEPYPDFCSWLLDLLGIEGKGLPTGRVLGPTGPAAAGASLFVAGAGPTFLRKKMVTLD